MTHFAERIRCPHGALVALTAFVFAVLSVAATEATAQTAQRIAEHFSSVRTMTGEFVQFGPRGEQTGGKFYIERPGKIRFDYEPRSEFRIISDGDTVVVENRKMETVDIYPLSKTPLKLLLNERIDLSEGKVVSVKEDPDLITVKLADQQLFGGSTITMMFDAKTYDLRQWTITDAQGKDTTVMLLDVEKGVTFGPSVFKIDYRRVNALARGKR